MSRLISGRGMRRTLLWFMSLPVGLHIRLTARADSCISLDLLQHQQ